MMTCSDPFLLGIIGGRLHVMVSPLESSRIEQVAPDAVYHDLSDLGFQELRESGLTMHQLDLELVSRAAAAMGMREAVVDPAHELPVRPHSVTGCERGSADRRSLSSAR